MKKHIQTNKVLDLYSGVGTIGLSVAGNKDLTLVEVDKSAYQELENNAKNFKNATPVLDKSENALNYIEPDQTVILDPPRAGCDDKLIQKLLEVKPEKIIYLSCNPATQARDIKKLLETYKIDDTKIFNFFPRTPHIENLIVLSL
ncbi:MAG: RsmD family RNA methyltransferase [Candidatus Saccharibacteria bacterium]|nr:RsmD family RNA methyltransferase [Candidatus Saccharibacteria bacterium]